MGPRGENPRRIRTGDEFTTFRSLQWSPRGRRLAYSKAYAAGNDLWEYTIESCDLKGEAVTVIVPGLAGQAGLCWMPDGRIIYSIDERAANNENTNLWEIRADPTTGQARGRSHSITNWLGIHTDRFSFSADGKRMVVQKSWGLLHTFVGRLQADSGLETPRRLTLEDSHDVPLAWIADSKAVVFSSDRTGVWKLYRQALDQAQAEPLTTGPDENRFARLSPDGRWVLYSSRARDETRFARYKRVSLSGGPPELVMQTQPGAEIGCPVSPATECILTEWSRDR
jgi:Tol biopolymer transport system component